MDALQKNVTIFGADTEFEGVLEFSDALKIDGVFSGTIKSGGDLQISKSALCVVDKMSVVSVVISGEVKGDIFASERIEMCSGSRIFGNVETARLRIADNAEFDGQVSMLEKAPEVDLFSVASDEYKSTLALKAGANGD